MEQTLATPSYPNELSNSLAKPVTITNVTLLSPGIWTGVDNQKSRYSPEGVRNGFLNTNWEGMNLFLDHKDGEGTAAAYWIGFIKNVKMFGEDLVGDLEIWHPLFAMFVKTAKARFGVSMRMNGREDFNTGADYSNYEIQSYVSGSLVDEPGCETSWLPKMLGKGDKNSKTVLGGNVSIENIKQLSNSKNNSSDKNLASNDVSNSEGSEIKSDEKHSCKEVEKMTDKVNQEKSEEEQKEVSESKEESKEEEKSESSTETSGEDVKELSAKFDKLSNEVVALTGLVQKSLAAGDESEEEAKDEAEEKSEEESEEKSEEKSDDELESTKSELEETKKELAAAKAELNQPDEKSLAAGSTPGNASDPNSGMLGFLREHSNLNY